LSLRRQRTPNKINTLTHLFNLSNVSSFPSPPSTESAEDPKYGLQAKTVLAESGISAFLAHKDIKVSEEWQGR
jgi:hypothetical protein